jgi:2-desacetyl-2-hydroxyethyl bacteriochlorophyllide A dehydrogenase
VEGFLPGDKVTMECFAHDGTCRFCNMGHYNHCEARSDFKGNGHGGFAEFTTMHTSALFKLPQTMTFEQGALVEPLAVAYRAIVQAGARGRDRVVVLGGGTIGLLCLAAARAAGVADVLITAKYPQQASIAAALGAGRVVDVTREKSGEAIQDWSDGMGADCVIETAGGAANFDAAIAATRKRGTVVLVAGYYEPLQVDLRRIVWSEIVVTGSNCYGYSGREKDFDAAIELIASGRTDPTRIVTHRFGLDDIAEAFRIAADKASGSVKVHVTA